MKELLREFLADLLIETSNATKQAKEAGLKHIPGSRGLWSKSGKKPATHSTKDGKFVTLAGTDKSTDTRPERGTGGIGSDIPKGLIGRKARSSGAGDAPTTSAVLRAAHDVTSKLISAVKGFRDKIYKFGAVGTGTEDSTKGEQSSCSSSEDFIAGRTLNVEGGTVPVPAGVTDEEIEQQKQAVRTGRGGKNLSEYEVTNRAIERAWMERERQRYIQGGSRPPADEWLRAAYRSGVSTRAILEERADLTATQTGLSDGTIPPPMVTDEGSGKGKEAATNYLQGLRDTTPEGSEERSHCDQLLLALETAEDTDTCIFYIRKDGKPGVLFISNKQGLNDPHGNTGPGARITRIASLAATSGLDGQGQVALAKAIKEARDAIGSSVSDATAQVKDHFDKQSQEDRVAADDRLRDLLTSGLPADRGRTKDYTDDILGYPPVKKELRDVYCAQNEEICKGKKPKEIDAIVAEDEEFKRANIGTAFRMAAQKDPNNTNIRKILIKLGTVATGSDDERLLGPILTVGSSVKAAAADAHSTIVSRVHEIDRQQCGNAWDDQAKACVDKKGTVSNGPATQTYVDAFMRDTHWDQYMCTDSSDDDCSGQEAVNATKLVDINGHKVPPAKFRECLASLTGFKARGEDADSPENQRALWVHLKRVLRVDSEEDSISMHGEGGKQVGKEKYRTKGAAASLLTYLGKDMAKCVTGKTDEA